MYSTVSYAQPGEHFSASDERLRINKTKEIFTLTISKIKGVTTENINVRVLNYKEIERFSPAKKIF